MDTLECIKTRRSVRKYKDKPVEWEKIVNILHAGKSAPCAGNIQNWKFIVIRDEANRKKVAKAALEQGWMEDAPVHIIVIAEPEKAARFYGTRGERLYTIQNCAAAVENMLLAAHAQGLGACWVGAFNEDEIMYTTNLPEEAIAHAIITIGYADEKPPMPPKNRIEHVTYLEKWWNRRKVPPYGWYSVNVEKGVKGAKKFFEKISKKVKNK
ncbi:nitroreductase family protein [Candidatus Woesearchaeota archaeon]|nr:nitroreductase family protein [Candidatus Woesearchaeota archaeon]